MRKLDNTIGFGPGIMRRYNYINSQKVGNRFMRYILCKLDQYVKYPKEVNKYESSISTGIKNGFRWIDYSCAYGDGRLLGNAIRMSSVNRKDLIITTRITNSAQVNHRVREEFMHFLTNAGLDYVDILQFHWPVTDCYLDTWKDMEKLYEEGYVKHLGVANCHQHHLDEIFKICKYKPEVGQFEIHPLFTQKPLIEYYQNHGIQVCAYTPLARFDDRLMRLPKLKQIADRYGKTVPQVVLRWHTQNGVIPIVRAFNPEHQKANLDIFDFELTAEEMKTIDSVNINSRLRYDPDNCDFSIL